VWAGCCVALVGPSANRAARPGQVLVASFCSSGVAAWALGPGGGSSSRAY